MSQEAKLKQNKIYKGRVVREVHIMMCVWVSECVWERGGGRFSPPFVKGNKMAEILRAPYGKFCPYLTDISQINQNSIISVGIWLLV